MIQPLKVKKWRDTTQYTFPKDILVTVSPYGTGIALSHQCDEWDIGSPEDLIEFMEALQAVYEWTVQAL